MKKVNNEKPKAFCKPDIMRGAFLGLSNEKLKDKLKQLENEREAIDFTIRKVENEIFYRDNPECRV